MAQSQLNPVESLETQYPTTGYTWNSPELKFSTEPPRVRFNLQLPEGQCNPANFVRSAKWSPDGLSVLGHCEDSSYQLYQLPEQPIETTNHAVIKPIASFRQPSPILDFIWYPTASCHDPASYCFVSSVRECPVKLLEAPTGRLRASYKIVDHCERQVAPHSMAFNLTASRLYCGFENAIEVFDVQNPGEGTRLHTTPSRKSTDGLKGIISALAFSAAGTYSDAYFAAGSLTPSPHNIVLYGEAQGENPVMSIGGGNTKNYGGVTQLRFHPFKPHILYASFRGRPSHGCIYAWDLRMVDSGTSNPPYHIFRVYRTTDELETKAKSLSYNQKMMFDIDVTGRWLSLGDQAGRISVFDLNAEEPTAGAVAEHKTLEEPSVSFPAFQFDAHSDAVCSVSFNPSLPLLLSTSGSRHFVIDEGEERDESDDEDAISLKKKLPITFDNSVKAWYLN